MPKISDIIDDTQKDKRKKFVRKEYRPWNLTETVSSSIQNEKKVQEPILSVEKDIESPAEILVSPIIEKNTQEKQVKVESDIRLPAVKPVTSNEFVRTDPDVLSIEETLIQLTGRQKELFIFILKNLIDNKSLITTPIYSASLIEAIPTTIKTISNAVRRLEAKGLVKSYSKRARGGYFRFEAREEVIQAGRWFFFKA